MLAASTVSRRHARLLFAGGGLQVEDLGSTNGTAVDGVRGASRQAAGRCRPAPCSRSARSSSAVGACRDGGRRYASRWDNLPGDHARRAAGRHGAARLRAEIRSSARAPSASPTGRATCTLHRDVAIKEYLPTTLALREGRTTVLPRSPDHAEQFAWGRERFLDEARTLARLDRTPAIVRVHDFLEANGTAYMVMALVEGETLSKRLMREQRLTPEAVERLLFPLLDGLEEVHAIGFLHRDIKPANIMVDDQGRPTLIDFGASRAAMAERSTTMTAIFTPGYAAAEQFTSAKLGPWTDIYGLAATLYHAITGRIPPSAIDRILNDTYEPLSELQPGRLCAGAAGRHRCRHGHPRRPTGRRASPNGGRCCGPRLGAGTGGDPHRPQAWAAGTRGRQTSKARLTIRGPALWGAVAAR